mmetsp:Transcript_29377/g.78933  ORF Transcript_29377/g.78933 Transcript_29377/m.78933 type:complete len:278 (+) Transcript_29377:352-1185(+)
MVSTISDSPRPRGGGRGASSFAAAGGPSTAAASCAGSSARMPVTEMVLSERDTTTGSPGASPDAVAVRSAEDCPRASMCTSSSVVVLGPRAVASMGGGAAFGGMGGNASSSPAARGGGGPGRGGRWCASPRAKSAGVATWSCAGRSFPIASGTGGMAAPRTSGGLAACTSSPKVRSFFRSASMDSARRKGAGERPPPPAAPCPCSGTAASSTRGGASGGIGGLARRSGDAGPGSGCQGDGDAMGPGTAPMTPHEPHEVWPAMSPAGLWGRYVRASGS